MNSGDSDTILLRLTQLHGIMTVEAATVLFPDVQPSAVTKRLARLTEDAKLEKTKYIPPRCCWHPYWRPAASEQHKVGAITLPRDAAVLCFCFLGEVRWELAEKEQGFSICVSDGQREAVFVDLNAKPDHIGRKLERFCNDHSTETLTCLTVLVPTALKGQTVWKSAKRRGLPLPVRCVAIDDLKELLGNAN